MEESFLHLIEELRLVRERRARLTERERELSSPRLTDPALIPEIYGWFRSALSEADAAPDPDTPIRRREFLFIVLVLFAPRALVGDRLPNGIRSALSTALPDVSPCVISNNIADATFFYRHYKVFRQEVERLYAHVLGRLEEKEAG